MRINAVLDTPCGRSRTPFYASMNNERFMKRVEAEWKSESSVEGFPYLAGHCGPVGARYRHS